MWFAKEQNLSKVMLIFFLHSKQEQSHPWLRNARVLCIEQQQMEDLLGDLWFGGNYFLEERRKAFQ